MVEDKVLEKPVVGTSPRLGKIEWHEPPEKPKLGRHHLHIWRVDMEGIINLKNLSTILSMDELKRAERFVIPEKRKVFISGRAALRIILALYTGDAPQGIVFNYLLDGKPILANEILSQKIQFNLSHSGLWMFLVVSSGLNVGIDIEEVERISAKGWALEHFFSAREREIFMGISLDRADSAFLCAWSMKEAAGKATGQGMTAAVGRLDSSLVLKTELQDGLYMRFYEDSFWFIRFKSDPAFIGIAAVEMKQEPQVIFFDCNRNIFQLFYASCLRTGET